MSRGNSRSGRSSADVVILGAGPAGLAAAWRAARTGRSVVVLESAPYVGGMAASFEVGGMRVDAGSHRLHPATAPALLADLRGLLGDDLQTRPRNGRLRVAGSWVGFPLKPVELGKALPPALLAGIARDALTNPLRKPRQDTYAEVLRAGLGPTLYGALYEPYARKLWGLDGGEIDGEQARRRVTADTPWKVAVKILSRARRSRATGEGGSGQGQIFHYPRRGFGQIVEALADAATAAGAEIRLSSPVERVVPRSGLDSAPQVRTADGTTVTGRHVFSTVPLPRLAAMTDPPAPAEVLAASGSLTFRAMVLVYLVHGGGRWTSFDAHYLPADGTPVTRISEPTNYRESADDPGDRSVLCVEIPCAPDDATFTADEATLTGIVTDTLARTGLPPLNVQEVVVRRVQHVYPVYTRGYGPALETLDTWARGISGVTTFGRLGLFAHDNTHHALAMAYDAVDALTPVGFDHGAWAMARLRFADHVVED
ncbi:protoporphyrinogen/coproporphyrinogen oxidase [Sporichthya polymorpha]|uniref:protoporphyrinogen/coproporphyrinogen oxidase n=1 Tax=Sporichthya polymorpha TaxID=35751 RepID=UPI00039C80A2|nr:FAD-dependent oxidoreductase [Sporichthya polymorpha]